MTNEEIIKANLSITDSLKALFHLNDIYLLLDAAREDEAIRFAEWYDKIFIKTGTIRDLYLKYKKQNP